MNETLGKNIVSPSSDLARTRTALFHKGDLVEVRSPAEIFSTLDTRGTLDGLPFMPEMIAYCGQRFIVAQRALKTCVDGHLEAFREFRNNDVVFLENQRCDGSHHDDCQRGCMIFWKEAWLKSVDEAASIHVVDPEKARTTLLNRLITRTGKDRYFCQSSQLEQATRTLPRWRRLYKTFREVSVRNRSLREILAQLARDAFWKVRGLVAGKFPSGDLDKTPAESLNLKAGDWVEVKSYEEIHKTLDRNGKNRGMQFDLDMRLFCGKRYQVNRRLDRMIREDNGQMLKIKDTVILDQVYCQCIFATGGCPRAEAFYWREIWLKRIDDPA